MSGKENFIPHKPFSVDQTDSDSLYVPYALNMLFSSHRDLRRKTFPAPEGRYQNQIVINIHLLPFVLRATDPPPAVSEAAESARRPSTGSAPSAFTQ